MKKILLLLLISWQVQAQSYSIKGKLVDTTNAPLSFATVFLLNPSDSTMLTFSRANDDGAFEFKNVRKSDVVFQATYVGFLPLKKTISHQASKGDLDLGIVQMKPIDNELYEVVIRTARAPMAFKGDTVEYDASKFKVPPGSSVEDLLKRLPGFQVDSDGNIKAQGENITKVLVGGKRFFGNDPKAATKNLPSEAISKVQVFNDVSDQQKLTGVADGSREKTLNLELKDEYKKGAFGKFTAGAGTEDRLMGKGNYNKFDDKNQLSVVGFGNNINQTGLSGEDYEDFKGSQSYNWGNNVDFGFSTGGGGVIFSDGDSGDGLSIPTSWGPGAGLSKNFAAGVNYNYDTKKNKISSNYFYNNTSQTLEQSYLRDVLLNNTQYSTTGANYNKNKTGNHRGSIRFEKELDSLRSLIVYANGRIADRDQLSRSNQLFFNKTNEQFRSQDPFSSSVGNTYNLETSAVFRNKFKKNGRVFLISGNYTLNNNDNEGRQESNVREYPVTGESFPITSSLNLNQNVLGFTNTRVLKTSAMYAEPIGKKLTWETFLNLRTTRYDIDRDVFALGDPGASRTFVDSLSRYFTNDINYSRLGTSLKLNHKGFFLMAGVAAQKIGISGDLYGDQGGKFIESLNRKFPSVLPTFSLRYKINNSSFMGGNYSMSEDAPTLRNLQPYIDNANPMNLVYGNVNLGTSKSHNFGANFNTYNPVSFINVYTGVNYSLYRDRIVYKQTIDQFLIKYSTPENIKDGGNTFSGYAGMGFPIIKTKITGDLWANAGLNNSPLYINEILNDYRNTYTSVSLSFNVTPVKWLSWFFGGSYYASTAKYSEFSGQNQKTKSTGLNSDLNVQLPHKIFFGSQVNYSYQENKRLNFSLHRPLIGFNVYKIFGKSDRNEIRLSAYDILNKNVGISQNINQNEIGSTVTQTLSRYIMLTYSYNLRGMKNQLKKNRWD